MAKKNTQKCGIPVVEYQINKKLYESFVILFKLIITGIGIWLAYYLTKTCLFDTACNNVVSVFIAILSLACFQAAGFPVDKLANFKLT